MIVYSYTTVISLLDDKGWVWKIMNPQSINSAVDLMKVLGTKSRLQIICLLAQKGELRVSEIVKQINLEQSAISHQLSRLRSEGLLKSRRDGQEIFYCLDQNTKSQLAQKIITECGCLDGQSK